MFHGGESKEQTNITELSSKIEPEKHPCDSIISRQEDEFGPKIVSQQSFDLSWPRALRLFTMATKSSYFLLFTAEIYH